MKETLIFILTQAAVLFLSNKGDILLFAHLTSFDINLSNLKTAKQELHGRLILIKYNNKYCYRFEFY